MLKRSVLLIFLILSVGCGTVQAFFYQPNTTGQLNEYNLGKVSIKELNDFTNQKDSENYNIKFIIEGTIREVIKMQFTVDDATGRISIRPFQVGLGGINDGDIVIVEGYAKTRNFFATKISLASSLPPNNIPTPLASSSPTNNIPNSKENIAPLASSSPTNNIPNSNENIVPKTNGFGFLLTLASILIISLYYKR